MDRDRTGRRWLTILFLTAALPVLGAASALLGACGPFTDVLDDAFCPFVLEIFTMGISTGVTPSSYDPNASVTRLQMAAFLSRGTDRMLQRHSRRARYARFWTPQNGSVLGLTTVGSGPTHVRLDSTDLWVANSAGSTVSRVRGSDGKLLETWTGATNASGVLAAIGRILVAGRTDPGRLYTIDPSLAPGAVTQVSSSLGNSPDGIAFDGARVWTANLDGTVSIALPAATIPWTVTTVATGAASLSGALYDGENVWVTNNSGGTLLKLNAAGAVLQTVTLGGKPLYPVFDGLNIWVPNNTSSSVAVVRASSGVILQTLTGNGLGSPNAGAFDGERVLITDNGDRVSLWKAADLTPLGSFTTGADTHPLGAASDGLNFWITLSGTNHLARF